MSTNILRIIWFFLKSYKLHLLALFSLSLAAGVLEAINVAAVYPILSTAFNIGAEESNLILNIIRTLADLVPVDNTFVSFVLVFLIAALLAFAARLALIRLAAIFSSRLVEENQREIYRNFLKADYQYFIDHKEGELIYNIATAPQSLSVLVTSVTELSSQVILSISIMVLLISLSWQGTIVLLAIGIGYYLLTRYLGEKVSYYSAKGILKTARESNIILNETISGIKQVKVFNTESVWIDRFNRTIAERWKLAVRRNVWQQIPARLLMFILYVSIGVIALAIKVLSPEGFITLIPTFGTFTFAVFRLFPIIGTLGTIVMQIMGALPNCESVYSTRNTEISSITDGNRVIKSFESQITFDHVTFSYKGRRIILEDVSMVFPKGKATVIVGRSGSGKTTLINLLLRLFDPEQGQIRVDGVNLKDSRLSSWLSKIGFVSQDTYIFNDTIRNNIVFGSREYSDEDITAAARLADAHKFILELPKGYETVVGDKGVRLSGGQRQRIAVARAIVKKPEIFIFDEATNALDNISEAAVQGAIDQISKEHTVITIAHRLSTIGSADNIVVLEEGRVAEQGTHQELLRQKGAYWKLYRSQPD